MTSNKYRRVQIVKGKFRESTTKISLEASRAKGRQSNVNKLLYLPLIMPKFLSGARGRIQHPLLLSKIDEILACFGLMHRRINR